MSRTPVGDFYRMPGSDDAYAVRVTRVSSYADGGDVGGLIGWAVNIGAQGAVETVEDWALETDKAQQLVIAKKKGHQLRSGAAAKGTKVHNVLPRAIQGKASTLECKLAGEGYILAALRYIADHELTYIDTERTVYGNTMLKSSNRPGSPGQQVWWAGTMDFLASDPKGQVHIVDWKTGSPHLAYTAQMGGYVMARQWCQDDDSTHLLETPRADKATVVYLRDDATYSDQPVRLDVATDLWLACLTLHLQTQRN